MKTVLCLGAVAIVVVIVAWKKLEINIKIYIIRFLACLQNLANRDAVLEILKNPARVESEHLNFFTFNFFEGNVDLLCWRQFVIGQKMGDVSSIGIHFEENSPGSYSVVFLGSDGPCAYKIIVDEIEKRQDFGRVIVSKYYPKAGIQKRFPGIKMVTLYEIHCSEAGFEMAKMNAGLEQPNFEGIIVPLS